MAMTISENLHLQPTDQVELDEEGAQSLTIEWKGPYASCKATADTITPGDAIPTSSTGNAYTPQESVYGGYHAVSWTIRRGPGDTAVLAVVCRAADAVDTSQAGGGSGTAPFRTVYSLKSVRNDVSVLAYCGTWSDDPKRSYVERWMREPDPNLAERFMFRDVDGLVVGTEDNDMAASVPLIKKIMKGTERVIRFYPQLTIRRSYYAPPTDAFSSLGYVDTPPSPSNEKTLAPSGVQAVISAHEWLKVQDDCDEQQDRTWMRTESWIGILITEGTAHPWDPDLYGPNRWPMPYSGEHPSA